jgi:carbamate kinase
MRVVTALGGNALLRRGQELTAENQRVNARAACRALAPIALEHELVISHGNGPQVGLLALQGSAYTAVDTYPLDVLGAQTEGMIGYIIEQELGNELPFERHLATLLTQIEVDPDDPAFADPTKPIGPLYDKAEAERLAGEKGWVFKPDGDKLRRVVPSPLPKRIFEIEAIEALLEKGCVVICAGGGGIPTTYTNEATPAGRRLIGIEAVIDKDLASALLAIDLGADVLAIVTDVDAVYEGWGTPEQRAIRRADREDRRHRLDQRDGGARARRGRDDRHARGGGRRARPRGLVARSSALPTTLGRSAASAGMSQGDPDLQHTRPRVEGQGRLQLGRLAVDARGDTPVRLDGEGRGRPRLPLSRRRRRRGPAVYWLAVHENAEQPLVQARPHSRPRAHIQPVGVVRDQDHAVALEPVAVRIGPPERRFLVGAVGVRDGGEQRSQLRVPVRRPLHGFAIEPERDVVHERPAVHLGEVDDAFDAVDQRFEGADDVVAIDAEIEREMVAGPRRHAGVRERVLGCDRRHDRLRPVAARHGERVGSARYRVADELGQVRAGRELAGLDPSCARLGGQPEALGLAAPRPWVVEEHGPLGARRGRECGTARHGRCPEDRR